MTHICEILDVKLVWNHVFYRKIWHTFTQNVYQAFAKCMANVS